MNLDKVILRQISLPLKVPFRSSVGVETIRRVIIIEAHMGDTIGYGEASPLSSPYYNEETLETVWHVLSDFLIPLVLETDWDHPKQVAAALTPVKRHGMAKAGLEGAIWDLWCKVHQVPLYTALGGTVDKVSSGIAIGLSQIDDVVERVEQALARHYHRIKIKIEPGRDVQVIQTLRKKLGAFPLMADANSAYNPSHIGHLRRLDAYDLLMIEQPFDPDDYLNHATLQQTIQTPICLDEGIESKTGARQAIELQSCRVINIKPGRVGGLTEALRIHDLCVRHDMPVWCGGLLESDIGRAHNVALSSLPGFTLPGDLSPTSRYFKEQLVSPAFELDREGYIQVPSEPGIGVTVDRDLLSYVTERTVALSR